MMHRQTTGGGDPATGGGKKWYGARTSVAGLLGLISGLVAEARARRER